METRLEISLLEKFTRAQLEGCKQRETIFQLANTLYAYLKRRRGAEFKNPNACNINTDEIGLWKNA
jgi:hypothetical protein